MAMQDVIEDVGAAAEAITADEGTPLFQVESLCMRCGENGIMRLQSIRFPHFCKVVLMAFECPHCNERNNEVLFAGQPQPQGCTFRLKVPAGDSKILNTEVVKSDVATIESARSRVMATQDMNEDVGAAAEALTKDGGALPHQIESVCMRCGENGIMRLQLS